jgi:transcriptional regulator with XRE-family HTH domain
MPARESMVQRGRRRGRRIFDTLSDELRETRLTAGLRLTDVGGAVGLSKAEVSRIERGLVRAVDIVTWSSLFAAVGRDLSVRTFPAGPPLRDAAHVALIERFRGRLAPALRLRLEVPMPIEADQRAIDACVVGLPVTIAVEAETRLRDLQSQVRTARLKQRDAGIDRLILLVRESSTNRTVLRATFRLLAEDFPVSGDRCLRALGQARDPGGDAVVVL